MPEVPQARSIRKSLVSPGNRNPPTSEKKKALRPKAAKGKAVAVPLWCGQFRADVLTAAANAVHAPRPDRNEKRQIKGTEPDPLSKAMCSGKYPRASIKEPASTAGRGPFASTSIPTGRPSAYMPRLPDRPTRLLSVVVYLRRSAN